jgi:choline-sulfatase
MSDRLNVLVMFADQLRADALACYGNPICQTPNLDRLAAEGVLFENSFTPNPICVPARATLATGNYPHRATGIKENHGRITDDQPRMAQHFSDAGYETYACGKLHYVPYAAPDEPRLLHGFQHCDLTESGRLIAQHDPEGKLRGLEDYHDYLADVGWAGYTRAHGIGNNDVRPCPTPLPAEHHVDHWVADRTIDRLRTHAAQHADQPFVTFCSFPKPHSPYDPPAEFADLYDPRTLPAPFGDASSLADRNPYMDRLRYTHGISSLSPAALRVIRKYYYGLISHQDAQIGRVLAALDELGFADNTIVVYSADHGDLMGDFGTFFKCSFLEGSVRVPMLWRGPGLPAGERRKQLVGLQDVLPTLAAMTDCPLDADVHGLDIKGTLTGDAPTRDVFYSQCLDVPRQSAMLTDGRWKYAWAQEGPTEELYDLEEDPHELVNLSAEVNLAPWRERLIAEATRLGDTAIVGDDGKLVTNPLNRASFKDLPICGMGWRHY